MADLHAEEGVALNQADGSQGQGVVVAGVNFQCFDKGDVRDAADGDDVGEERRQPPNQPRRLSSIGGTAGCGRRVSAGAGGVVFHQHDHQALELGQDGDCGKDPNDNDDAYRESIALPQSTHTMLFTERVFSVPWLFAFLILAISIVCLLLAASDNLDGRTPENKLNVPANVSGKVRAAQYFSIIIAVLMEEEIPTGLYLLRTIPRSSLEDRLGSMCYRSFVVSAMCRLAVGYLFLLNVFLVIVQSERVLDMFYDMLALQFVSMIDDIAFKLAQLDILGKHLRDAASASCYQAEFERKPYLFRRKMTIFVKCVFVFNFLFLLGGVITIAVLQQKGHFQCHEITVTFGEDIWKNAWVKGRKESTVLVYSYFNGIYEKEKETYANRPVYRELRKSENTHFTGNRVGATIKYCEEELAWVFTHQDIMKTQTSNETSCPWLLRSQPTNAFDLLDVPAQWEVWVGVIDQEAKLAVTCNACKDDTDCNLNGRCDPAKETCECNDGHTGTYCELEAPCPRLISDMSAQWGSRRNMWSVPYLNNCDVAKVYGRPIYTLMEDISNVTGDAPMSVSKNDRVSLLYSGSRWIGSKLEGGRNLSIDEMDVIRRNFHAFWEDEYNLIKTVSDPTHGSMPVGVDFYAILDTDYNYGPFGSLYPLQYPPGRGLFRCDYSVTDEAELCKTFLMAQKEIVLRNKTT